MLQFKTLIKNASVRVSTYDCCNIVHVMCGKDAAVKSEINHE